MIAYIYLPCYSISTKQTYCLSIKGKRKDIRIHWASLVFLTLCLIFYLMFISQKLFDLIQQPFLRDHWPQFADEEINRDQWIFAYYHETHIFKPRFHLVYLPQYRVCYPAFSWLFSQHFLNFKSMLISFSYLDLCVTSLREGHGWINPIAASFSGVETVQNKEILNLF